MDGDTTRETIPTNLRLLLVLEEVAKAGVPVTPTDVNMALDLPKPTIHRLFATLEEEGFLQRDLDGRTYSPGHRLLRLSGGILSSLHLRTARQAVLGRLSREIGETCNLAMPDRDAMIYLERVETEWPLRIQLPQGTRVPFHCTAGGKLYLSSLAPHHLQSYLAAAELTRHTANTLTSEANLRAEIARIQRQRYALDREEFMDDMLALAVPIEDRTGRLMATLSFHAPTQRFNVARALTFLDTLRRGADELAALVEGEAAG